MYSPCHCGPSLTPSEEVVLTPIEDEHLDNNNSHQLVNWELSNSDRGFTPLVCTTGRWLKLLYHFDRGRTRLPGPIFSNAVD